MNDIIQQELDAASRFLTLFKENPDQIEAIKKGAEIMIESLNKGGKIIVCGNGGSMCDAMHFVSELKGKYREKRRPLAAIAISDPAYLTCTSNDMGFEYVFSREVCALAKPEDVLVLITTSGNSQNVHNALGAAHLIGLCKIILLTGNGAGAMADDVLNPESLLKPDVVIMAPNNKYADRIQELHIKVIHIWCHLIERGLGLTDLR